MGKTLTIRNIPEPIYRQFAEMARKNHRNVEAHGRFLIEQEARRGSLETCGDILDTYAEFPSPDVAADAIESYQTSRGGRSKRLKV